MVTTRPQLTANTRSAYTLCALVAVRRKRLKSSTDVLPTGENYNYKRNNLWEPLIDFGIHLRNSVVSGQQC
jgi:hypothetical protein